MSASISSLNQIIVDLRTAISDQKNPQVRLYFDTQHVRRAVLGAQEYISLSQACPPFVDKKMFQKPQALAACLLSAGFIGEFSMLPPHQAEFIRQLSRNEVFSRRPLQIEDANFLRQVGIEDPWGTKITENSEENDVRKYLKQYAGKKTETFFKAIQCIRMLWWERLSDMREKKIFVPSGDDFDIDAMSQREDLSRILKVLETIRGKYNHDHSLTINNLNDAFSLLMLSELVRRYRTQKGENIRIPRFYDPTGRFLKVAKLAGIQEDLIIDLGDCQSSVFVSTKYLIYRASIRAKSAQEGDEYSALLESIPTVANFSKTVGDDYLPQMNSPPQLKIRLEEWLDLSFLKNVWLESIAVDDLHGITERWTHESVRTEEFVEEVRHTIRSATKDALNSAYEYKQFSGTWTRLTEEIQRWLDRHQSSAGVDSENKDMMLLRISPTHNIENRIRRDLGALFEREYVDGNASSVTYSRQELFSSLYKFMKAEAENRTFSIDRNIVEYAACALWSIRSLHWLLDTFRRYADTHKSFFVSAVCAGAALNIGRESAWAERTVVRLDSQIDNALQASDEHTKNWLLLTRNSSVAYLLFHLWTAKWNKGAKWRLRANIDTAEKKKNSDIYIRKAIQRADAAWHFAQFCNISKEDVRERVIYVANQRLYYLVEEGSIDRLSDMEEAYENMAGYRNDSNFHWKLTYSDTLARYFAFRAKCSDTARSWNDFMNLAERNFEAVRFMRGSPVVEQFDEYLSIARSRGYQAKHENNPASPA